MKIRIVLILITLFFQEILWAQTALENIYSERIVAEGVEYPSCRLFEHRAKERAKVLREKKHAYEKQGENIEMDLTGDHYSLNKFFLEDSLWYDETILVQNLWKVPADMLLEIQTSPEGIYLWLQGDGINWRENWNFFPDEVRFELRTEDSTLFSEHRAYFVDLCRPRKNSELHWYPKNTSDTSPIPTGTFEEIQEIEPSSDQ